MGQLLPSLSRGFMSLLHPLGKRMAARGGEQSHHNKSATQSIADAGKGEFTVFEKKDQGGDGGPECMCCSPIGKRQYS